MAYRRLVASIAVVVALVVVVPLTGARVERAAQEARVQEAAGPLAHVEEGSWKEDPLAALDALEAGLAEGLVRAGGETGGGDGNAGAGGVAPALSEAFTREVRFPPGSRDVRAAADGLVVGCVVDAEEADALAAVEGALAGCGWTAVPLGGVTGATFIKEGGELEWMCVTCTETGSGTAVVYRIQSSK